MKMVKSISLAVVAATIIILSFSASVKSASYVFTGAVNGDWYEQGNWDSGIVPGPGDEAVIESHVTQMNGPTPTVNKITLNGNSSIQNVNISATLAELNGSSYLASGSFLSSNTTTFNDGSYNHANITGNVIFKDESYNSSSGQISGDATIECRAYNSGVVSGQVIYTPCNLYYRPNGLNREWTELALWYTDEFFTNSALRLPTSDDTVHIHGDIMTLTSPAVSRLNVYGSSTVNMAYTANEAYFYDTSENQGTLTMLNGSNQANFYSQSKNQGSIVGNAYFECGAENTGNVSGTVTDQVCINNVIVVESDGVYGVGSNLHIQVMFTAEVNAPGTPAPELLLRTGLDISSTTRASFDNLSYTPNTNTLHFIYPISEGEYSDDLDYVATSSFIEMSGNVTSVNGGPVLLKLPVPGSTGSIGFNKNIKVDGIRPTLLNIQVVPLNTSARITWDTDELATSTVFYGPTSGYGLSLSSATSTMNHVFDLQNLIPGRTYHVKVKSKDLANNYIESADITFQTQLPASFVAPGPVIGPVFGSSDSSTGTYISDTSKQQATSSVFYRNLQVNDSGSDVKKLQVFLNTHGFTVSKKGPGSVGNETYFFGRSTQRALIKFQKHYNIKPSFGYFGLKTREFIYRKYGI